MRSHLRFVAAAALAATALAACSSSSKPAGTGTSPTTSATTSAASSTTVGASSTTAAPASGNVTVAVATTPLGKVLVDGKGRVLYVWDNDKTPGTSSCAGPCATLWPPVAVTGTPSYGPGLTASKFSVITRADGTKQLAVDGKPLYTFAGKAAGDTSGQGVGGFNVVSSTTYKKV